MMVVTADGTSKVEALIDPLLRRVKTPRTIWYSQKKSRSSVQPIAKMTARTTTGRNVVGSLRNDQKYLKSINMHLIIQVCRNDGLVHDG